MPVLGHRQPQPPHRVKRQVQRLDRTRLHRGKTGVGGDALCLHQLARRPGLRRALFGDIDVPPAGETVLEIPLRLAVTDEDELRHRSEEHTSELQSLMRISYAVFCLKKKKKNKSTHMLL